MVGANEDFYFLSLKRLQKWFEHQTVYQLNRLNFTLNFTPVTALVGSFDVQINKVCA
jgi:hypothetical protein